MSRSPQTLSVDDRPIVASWAADWAEHVLAIFEDAVPDAVAEALSLLPALGEDTSGPLGPGRLSGGHVGDAIRAIQELLEDH